MWAKLWAGLRHRFERAIDWDQASYLAGFLCAGGVFLVGQRYDPNFSILFHDWDGEAPWVYPAYVQLNEKCGNVIRSAAGVFGKTLNEDGHRLQNAEDRMRKIEADADRRNAEAGKTEARQPKEEEI
mmetsp:Transcript_29830/g.100462  ORF Transcript_29830/g.100462 Transcript_29830/m.100462 type:complete len:127 (+) Transcript_29830:91-471(+)